MASCDPLCCELFAESLPGIGVMLLDESLRVVYVNQPISEMFFEDGRDAQTMVGRVVYETEAFSGYGDCEKQFRLIIGGGNDCLVRTVRRGQQIYSLARRIEAEGRVYLFSVSRCVAAGRDEERLLASGYPVYTTGKIDLGEMNVLSPREIEVLAMIGQGLTTKEIAAELHRSEKTIGNHRISIGQKLSKSNKVELALMARNAGLRVEDAQRELVRIGAAGGG